MLSGCMLNSHALPRPQIDVLNSLASVTTPLKSACLWVILFLTEYSYVLVVGAVELLRSKMDQGWMGLDSRLVLPLDGVIFYCWKHVSENNIESGKYPKMQSRGLFRNLMRSISELIYPRSPLKFWECQSSKWTVLTPLAHSLTGCSPVNTILMKIPTRNQYIYGQYD